jgi:hypothetical protein
MVDNTFRKARVRKARFLRIGLEIPQNLTVNS